MTAAADIRGKSKSCPTCKGTGRYDVPVTTFGPAGRSESVTRMPCFACEGSGQLTPARARALAREAARWCRCAVPCEYPTVHMDRRGGVDWVECTACHKCLQVG
jgi:hypothetical protein